MLPAHIIDQIREREAKQRTDQPQPVLELPLPPKAPRPAMDESERDRGIVIIEL